MIIGITGNSGAGKTTVSKILAKKINAKIINADEIVKEFQQPGMLYYNEIVSTFGQDILQKDLKINRKKLAEIIYKNKEEREKINKITEKYITQEIIERIKKTKAQNIILDVPLLFESRLNKICDETISVVAKNRTKIKRICKREKIEKEIAKKRLNIQPKNKYYKNHSSNIIKNNNSKIEEKIEKVWRKICLKHGKN